MERRLKTVAATESTVPAARWWQTLSPVAQKHAGLRCELCPRACTLAEGEHGACRVRRNRDERMVLTAYGRASGFRIAAIETAALYHFHPGSATLSLATTGCNLACAYCANGEMLDAPDTGQRVEQASPEGIARAAQAYGAGLVAFTDGDPVSSAEYAIDIAVACRARGLRTVAATAGFIMPTAAREFFATFDAVNVGVKAFCDATYARLCNARLQPVLDTLCHLRFETRCWLEISYVLVPGHNDNLSEIGDLAAWIVRELGADVPLHFASLAFKTRADAALPGADAGRARLAQARQVALDRGLYYVYTEPGHGSEGATTFCATCQAALIERDAGSIVRRELGDDARCPYCQTPVAGYFGRLTTPSGVRHGAIRVPVRFARR